MLLFFYSCLAVFAGVGFLAFRQPIYSALSFAAVVLATCGVFVMNDAPYLAAATMIVYTGATIIVFLFVLMFAQRSRLQLYDLSRNAPVWSIVIGMLLFSFLFAAIREISIEPPAPHVPSQVAELGKLMFTDFIWTVEIVGLLLLVATIAAIVIAQDAQNDPAEKTESGINVSPALVPVPSASAQTAKRVASARPGGNR